LFLAVLRTHLKLNRVKGYGAFADYSRDVSFRPITVVSLQNHALLRPRDKQVVLKPADGHIRFSPRLLFMLESPSINKTIQRLPSMRLQDHSCFHSYQPICLAYQVRLKRYLLFLYPIQFHYHVSIPCSYLLSQFLAVISLILREICK